MSGLGIALLVLFVIICAIIIFLVLLQNEEGDSLGGLFAGGGNSAFGARSASVLTKTTYIAVALFFTTAFLLAFTNRSSITKSLSDEAKIEETKNSGNWLENETGEKASETETSSEKTDAKQEPPAETKSAAESKKTETPVSDTKTEKTPSDDTAKNGNDGN